MDRQLSRKMIVHEAIALVDERGLDDLSLRTVARRLGVKAPSLYNYVANKTELLAEMARTLLLEARLPQHPAEDWREFMVEVSLAARRAILEHPHAALLLLQFFPRETLLSAYERTVEHIDAPTAMLMMIVEGVEKFTLGSALFAAASLARNKPSMPAFDAGRFPGLAAAVADNPYADEEKMFVETLRLFLSAFATGQPPQA